MQGTSQEATTNVPAEVRVKVEVEEDWERLFDLFRRSDLLVLMMNMNVWNEKKKSYREFSDCVNRGPFSEKRNVEGETSW